MANPLGFGSEIGKYENPDIAIPIQGPAPAPVQLPCVGRTVIYGVDTANVANCAGFAGLAPGAPWNNPLVNSALGKAAAFVPKVTCAKPCNKVASIIWVGWDCGNQPLNAISAVEIAVECVLPNPNDISAFRRAAGGFEAGMAPIFLERDETREVRRAGEPESKREVDL